jgi:hypothetical protein
VVLGIASPRLKQGRRGRGGLGWHFRISWHD